MSGSDKPASPFVVTSRQGLILAYSSSLQDAAGVVSRLFRVYNFRNMRVRRLQSPGVVSNLKE